MFAYDSYHLDKAAMRITPLITLQTITQFQLKLLKILDRNQLLLIGSRMMLKEVVNFM